MTNLSLKEQLEVVNETKYPFVRHEGGVRANILNSFNDNETGENMLLVVVVDQNKKHRPSRFDGAETPRAYNVAPEATIRCVTAEYFDNNFWKGKN